MSFIVAAGVYIPTNFQMSAELEGWKSFKQSPLIIPCRAPLNLCIMPAMSLFLFKTKFLILSAVIKLYMCN